MSFSTEPKAESRADLWTPVKVAGGTYLRLPLQTRWLHETDDLVLSLKESIKLARPGDTVGVSEKVVNLADWLGFWPATSGRAPIPWGSRSRKRWSTWYVPSASGGSSPRQSAVR